MDRNILNDLFECLRQVLFRVPKTDDVGGTSQMDYFRLNQPLSSVETLHKTFVC
jgi:hypothetical protein